MPSPTLWPAMMYYVRPVVTIYSSAFAVNLVLLHWSFLPLLCNILVICSSVSSHTNNICNISCP